MRTATLTGILLVACTYAASAQQFTVLPQVGLEVSRTFVKYNNLSFFAPVGKQLSPQLGVRMDYSFKQGGGPFVGLATSRSGLNYNFSEPATGMKDYNASVGNVRLNFQAGYQLSTKPIYFKRSSSGNKAVNAAVPAEIKSAQSRCGHYSFSNRCSRYSSSAGAIAAKAAPPEKGWSMTIRPLAGVALTSAVNPDVNIIMKENQPEYEYRAGNWTTAIITGAAFEFGKNDQRKFTVSMNCLRGITNLGTKSIATTSNGKTTITDVRSSVSSWNLTAGIPLTIYKKKTAVKQVQMQAPPPPYQNRNRFEGRCSRYRYQGVI